MKNLNKTTVYIAIATLILGFGLGWLIFGGNSSEEHTHESSAVAGKETIWTCSMHPQIRRNEPGKCPICGMDLIPVGSDIHEDNPQEVKMSPTAIRLANIQTSVVSKKTPIKEIRLTGKVLPDERKIFSQTSHISGRVEKLMVNYTGEYIGRGRVIAYVYSPELVTAQEELFEAYKIRSNEPALYNAAREKLKNWKLTDIQIDEILELGKPREQFPILSDVNGIVIKKHVNLGDYVKQGSALFEVADLSSLWILFDVHESEMPWINVGDDVSFMIASLPGEQFKGKISFIDPVINPNTRVAKARVIVDNQGKRLKPEMFAAGIVKSTIQDQEPSITVPKSAVMWTGTRSVVYVKTTSPEGISFIMREVTLGPSLGNSYVIKEGLDEGEEIATEGTFSIDAAAQLAGKASMMSPKPTSGANMVMTGHEHENSEHVIKTAELTLEQPPAVSSEVKQALIPVIEMYLQLKDALVSDDFTNAIEKGKRLHDLIQGVDMELFSGSAHVVWMNYGMSAGRYTENLINAKDIADARVGFKPLSEQMIQIVRSLHPFDNTLYIQHCPMADNSKGADWLSNNEDIKNPYYGASMLTCGEVTEEIK